VAVGVSAQKSNILCLLNTHVNFLWTGLELPVFCQYVSDIFAVLYHMAALLPLLFQQLPVIQSSVIVRCRSCRTYINPFVTFIDVRRWKCNLCFRANEC